MGNDQSVLTYMEDFKYFGQSLAPMARYGVRETVQRGKRSIREIKLYGIESFGAKQKLNS